MAKCRISEKKLARCRAVNGAPYEVGFVRGGWRHFWVECHLPASENGGANVDFVNWKTGEWRSLVRDGESCTDLIADLECT